MLVCHYVCDFIMCVFEVRGVLFFPFLGIIIWKAQLLANSVTSGNNKFILATGRGKASITSETAHLFFKLLQAEGGRAHPCKIAVLELNIIRTKIETHKPHLPYRPVLFASCTKGDALALPHCSRKRESWTLQATKKQRLDNILLWIPNLATVIDYMTSNFLLLFFTLLQNSYFPLSPLFILVKRGDKQTIRVVAN